MRRKRKGGRKGQWGKKEKSSGPEEVKKIRMKILMKKRKEDKKENREEDKHATEEKEENIKKE